MLEKWKSLKIGESVYNEISKFVNELEPYRFNLTEIKNGGFVFQVSQPDQKFYFGEIIQQAYKLYYFSNNTNSKHLDQLKKMDEIVKTLISLKNIEIDKKNYKILNVYINGNPNPDYGWTAINLDSFDSEFQVYSLDLTLNIYNE